MPLHGRVPLSSRSVNITAPSQTDHVYKKDEMSTLKAHGQAQSHTQSHTRGIANSYVDEQSQPLPPIQVCSSTSILNHPLFELLFTDMTPSPIDHSHHFERVAKLRELPDYTRLLRSKKYIHHILSFLPHSKYNIDVLESRFLLCKSHLSVHQHERISQVLETLSSIQRVLLHSRALLDTLHFYVRFLTALFQRTSEGEPHHDIDFLAHPVLNDMFFYLDLEANLPPDSPGSLFTHYQSMIGHTQLALDQCIQKLTRFPSSPDFQSTLVILDSIRSGPCEQQHITPTSAAAIIARRIRAHATTTRRAQARAASQFNPNLSPRNSDSTARLAHVNRSNIHQTGMIGHLPLSDEIIAALAKVQGCHLRAIDDGVIEQEKQAEKEEKRRNERKAEQMGLCGLDKRLFLEDTERGKTDVRPSKNRRKMYDNRQRDYTAVYIDCVQVGT